MCELTITIERNYGYHESPVFEVFSRPTKPESDGKSYQIPEAGTFQSANAAALWCDSKADWSRQTNWVATPDDVDDKRWECDVELKDCDKPECSLDDPGDFGDDRRSQLSPVARSFFDIACQLATTRAGG